jgi:hypothetical protein
MVWPIIRGKSYVGETVKSMKVGEMVVAQEDGWRKIASLTMSVVSSTSRTLRHARGTVRHFALAGQRNLTIEQVRKLSTRFKLPADVFIPKGAVGARAYCKNGALGAETGDAQDAAIYFIWLGK